MPMRKDHLGRLKAAPIGRRRVVAVAADVEPDWQSASPMAMGQKTGSAARRTYQEAPKLDLLLQDADPETSRRYEVEIQLGATDESHIIRTIEYWDIEKTRYPLYEHVAVLVAEDITSRFLNVISLFNKAIPLIAIHLRALDIGDVLTINATTVLDLARPGTEDEDDPGQTTDRGYWVSRGSESSMAVADRVLSLVNEINRHGPEVQQALHRPGSRRDRRQLCGIPAAPRARDSSVPHPPER